MNTLTRNRRFLIIVVLLAILLSGQLVYAQDSQDCPSGVPQWVLDRQQYETTYVYAPSAGDVQLAENVARIPQWALDRQQYETAYVYVPPVGDFASADNRCSLVQTSDS